MVIKSATPWATAKASAGHFPHDRHTTDPQEEERRQERERESEGDRWKKQKEENWLKKNGGKKALTK